MSSSVNRIIGLLVVLILLLGALYFFVTQFGSTTASAPESAESAQVPQELVTAVRSGDYDAAIEKARTIMNNTSASADQKAFAAFSVIGSEFRDSGDVTAWIADIQKLKEIISDQSISPKIRANAVNTLSLAYSISGRNSVVFDEIYKGEPYSSYKVAGDPDLSGKKLAEWSETLWPTSFAQIMIARWNSEQPIVRPSLTNPEKLAFAKAADEYLKKADAMSLSEAASPDAEAYFDSTRYLVYRYWRTIIYGRLALPIPDPYAKNYREVYEEFIKFAGTQNNVLAKGYLLYARMFFAQRLLQQSSDKVAAVEQLDLLAAELKQIPNTESNVFTKFVRAEKAQQPTSSSWKLISSLMNVSPAFKAAIEEVVAR
ncbi:MAG: hypothetical protein RIQ56_918 [Candidatus Parcubacteria bacterium]|jgi:hypothetical protein